MLKEFDCFSFEWSFHCTAYLSSQKLCKQKFHSDILIPYKKKFSQKKSRPAAEAINNEVMSTDQESDLIFAKELDMTIKTTDSGHGGSSVGSHSPSNPLPEIGRQQVTLLPNSGPPPRHLLPAKLKPSPAVKMHPPGVIFDFKGKAAFDSYFCFSFLLA